MAHTIFNTILTEATGGYKFECVEGNSEELKCIHCNYLLKDAKELPCGHLICGTCLEQISQQERFVSFLWRIIGKDVNVLCAVSYTHLTLPTICSV